MADRSIRSSQENQELAAFRKEHGRKWRIALRQAVEQFSASDVLRAVYHREGPDLPLQARVTHENSPEVQRRLELFCAVFVMLGEGATINVPRTAPDATKLALALLRLCVSPDDRQSDEAFRRVCNVPARGLGDAMLARLEQEAQTRDCSLLQAVTTCVLPPKARAGAIGLAEAVLTVASSFHEQTLADALFQILKLSGYREALCKSGAEDAADELENLRELIELAAGFPDPRSLLDHAALASAAPGEDAGGTRVQLMTLHKAKGLEYAHVFLPAWEKGIFPGPFNEDSEEERRLAYVALTRGKERVAITYCSYRRGGGTNGPNDYITDIPANNRHRGWLHQAPPPVRSVRASSFREEMEALELMRIL